MLTLHVILQNPGDTKDAAKYLLQKVNRPQHLLRS